MYKTNFLLRQYTCKHTYEGGYILYTYVDTEYAPEKCSLCNGTGYAQDRICEACGGQGDVLVAQPARICYVCGGSGCLEIGICRACGGSGWSLL